MKLTHDGPKFDVSVAQGSHSPGTMASTLSDLPDGCLEAVLVAATADADSPALNNIMSTCKRFLRLVSSPSVPRNVTVRVPANARFPVLRDCPGVTSLVTSEWPVAMYADRVTALTRLDLYLDVHAEVRAPLPTTLKRLRVEEVRTANGNRATRDYSFLSTLTSLTSLTVYGDKYEGALGVLAPLTALQRFKAFHWMGCSANLMTGRDNLRELGWSHYSAPLPSLPRELTSLSVRVEIDGIRDMDALAWFPAEHLRSLTVLAHHPDNDNDGLGVPAFIARLPEFTSLTKLLLSYGDSERDPTSDGALRAVAKLPKLVDLWMDVDGPDFTRPPDLNQLSVMTNLTSLAFRSYLITDLSPLATLAKLELLYLQPLMYDADIYMHPPEPDAPASEPVTELPEYLPPLPSLRELRMEFPRQPRCLRPYDEPDAVRFVNFHAAA
jgi:hypothetical protein